MQMKSADVDQEALTVRLTVDKLLLVLLLTFSLIVFTCYKPPISNVKTMKCKIVYADVISARIIVIFYEGEDVFMVKEEVIEYYYWFQFASEEEILYYARYMNLISDYLNGEGVTQNVTISDDHILSVETIYDLRVEPEGNHAFWYFSYANHYFPRELPLNIEEYKNYLETLHNGRGFYCYED
jgi:hypothetical protein